VPAFNLAFTAGNFDALLDMLRARTGKEAITEPWVRAVVDEGLMWMRDIAPCKDGIWISPGSLPDDALLVMVSAMSRLATNPTGLRSESIGDYQATYAGDVGVGGNFFNAAEQAVITRVADCNHGEGSGPLYSLGLYSPTMGVYGDAGHDTSDLGDISDAEMKAEPVRWQDGAWVV